MGAAVDRLSLDFVIFKITMVRHKMHNWTIVFGLFLCMTAGAVTVTQGILPGEKIKTHRLFRTATRAARRGRRYLEDLCN
jgi:hypothetical protein